MLYRKRVLAAKVETTVGTAISVSGTDAAMNVFNLVANPTATSEQRMGQGAFGQLSSVVGLQTGQFTFLTEITDDGSGGAPAWLQTLLAGCGVTYSTGVFSPRSEAPGSNVKTLTLGAFVDGVYKQIAGAVGTVSLAAPVGQRVMLSWTFQGRWTAPTDVALATPTYPTLPPLMAKGGSVTIGSWTPCFSNFTLDLGNVVSPRPCLTALGGLHSFIVTDRMTVGTIDPESTLVATNPLYTQWINSTEQVLDLVFEGDGYNVTIDAAKFQVSNAQEGDRGGQQIDTVTYQLNRGNAGNDEFTITFAEV